jgi:hypothetical protein
MTLWQWFQPVSFQIMWLTLILGGNTWLAVSVAILVAHFVLSPSRSEDFKILLLAFVGFSADLIMAHLGFFIFNQWPLWLLILWAAFVLNLGHSMRFLRRLKLIYLMNIGALGGAYAYWVSWKLGAVEWPYGTALTVVLVAAIWAIILPLFVKVDLLTRKPHHD